MYTWGVVSVILNFVCIGLNTSKSYSRVSLFAMYFATLQQTEIKQ